MVAMLLLEEEVEELVRLEEPRKVRVSQVKDFLGVAQGFAIKMVPLGVVVICCGWFAEQPVAPEGTPRVCLLTDCSDTGKIY